MGFSKQGSIRSSVLSYLAVLVGCGSLTVAACAGRAAGPSSGDVTADRAAVEESHASHASGQLASARGTGSLSRVSAATTTPIGGPALTRGGELYNKFCTICHGDAGDGAGKFAYLMNPRPRNFKDGKFKLSTTRNQIPTDDDLIRTIGRGMPGSAMPPWDHLPLTDLSALAKYVRQFHIDATTEKLEQWVSDGVIVRQDVRRTLAERTRPSEPVVVPPEPAFDEIRWFTGRRLYLENCASCHGTDGNPVAEEVKVDAEGYPVPPRSFVNGIFKGGSDGHQVYVRILKGMRGTPMPASEGIYSDDEMWDIIHYVESLARAGAQQRAQLRQGTFVAPNVRGPLPSGPTDSAWEQARPLYVALTPLWWTEDRIEGLIVQALHNTEDLAIRLSWIDPTSDDRAVRHDEFRDGVAIQFSLSSDPPFYMGDSSEHGGVNIWFWKADRERNIREGYQDIDSAFPDRAVDLYPEHVQQLGNKDVREWPSTAITDHDSMYITAWGAGNLVSDPTLKTPVECLVARGPGTLAGKPANAQLVLGTALYERGVWQVQLQRSMTPPHGHDNGDERAFCSGDYLPVSFAIWNGSAGDRDGKKNISIWQKMVIE